MPIQPDKNKHIYIVEMKLINIDTKEEMLLFERKGSRCHFANELTNCDYIIQLRVDWDDIKNSDPLLDADIYRNIFGRKGKKIRYGSWHHTEKKYDQDSNNTIYLFRFENLQLRLMSKISVSMGIGIDAILEK